MQTYSTNWLYIIYTESLGSYKVMIISITSIKGITHTSVVAEGIQTHIYFCVIKYHIFHTVDFFSDTCGTTHQSCQRDLDPTSGTITSKLRDLSSVGDAVERAFLAASIARLVPMQARMVFFTSRFQSSSMAEGGGWFGADGSSMNAPLARVASHALRASVMACGFRSGVDR